MTNSPYMVKAVFTFKDNESKDKFIDFCNGDKGLSVTRARKGCISLDCYEKVDNPLAIVLWQKWESKEDQESYIQFRHEDGSFDFLGELVACPPDISPIRPVIFKTDRQQIEEVVRDMCDKDHTRGMQHMDDECLFIRPTGNPLNKTEWDSMMNNEDVSVESNELMKINKVDIEGDMAYVVYTNHGKFNYKGTANDDVAVLTAILKRVEGHWRLVHGQRSTGRNPDEPMPSFE